MKVNLIRKDGEQKIIEIPDSNGYPEVIFAGGHAFKKYLQTNEYVEVSYWHVPLAESWDFLK